MADLTDRLAKLGPTIQQMLKIGGTAGLSLGVIQGQSFSYHASYGYRDVNQKLPITTDTVFPVCSLTKAMTAAALALLVDDGKISWNTKIADVLPSFKAKEDNLHSCSTVADILCHRTGMAWGDNLYVGTNNNVLIPKKDSLKYLASQDQLLPFRGQFQYNNYGYEVAGLVIEKVAGVSYFAEFVKANITDKLQMHRTFFQTPAQNIEDVANSYNALDNGTPVQIHSVRNGDDNFGGASGGMRSSTDDLMKLYRAFLDSFSDQFHSGKTATAGNPIRRAQELMSAKVPLSFSSQREKSYGFGWARTQLPGPMGDIGCNPGLMPNGMPTVGKGVPSQLVLFHQGSLPGALSAVLLLPESDTAVIVLTNSLALCDTPDWVAQLVLEEIIQVPKSSRNDYIEATRQSVAENAKWFPETTAELTKEQRKGTSPRNLTEYVGTYWDDVHVFNIEVTLESRQLFWAFQGLESEKWPLTHYEDDTFTWIQPRNELAKRGRWVDQGAAFWKAVFQASTSNQIDKLYWVHDIGVPPVEHTRSPSASL